jgi:hypothetical protein
MPRSDLTQSAIAVHNINPDQQIANNRKMTDLGIDKSFAISATGEASLEGISNKIDEFQKQEGTKTGEFLIDIDKAQIAHDDIENLSALEQTLNIAKNYGWGAAETVLNLVSGMTAYPVSGVAGMVAPVWGGDPEKTLKWVQTNLPWPVTQEFSKGNIEVVGKIMNVLQLAGKGWSAIVEGLSTLDLQKASDVAEGKSGGSNVLVPVAGTIGEASAIFGLGEIVGATKSRITKIVDNAKKSKVKARDPEIYDEFARDVGKEHPPVEIKVEKFDEILKEVDKAPEDVLSNPDTYYEAKLTGDKMEVPVSDIAKMADDIKPKDINNMSMNDVPTVNELKKQAEVKAKQEKVSEGVKESQLAKRAEADAIEKKLTEDLGDLATYKTENMKKWAEDAQKILDKDYEQAKRIAMGEELPPEGVHVASVYEAVKIRALQEGDVATIEKLATESTVPTRLSELGQEIKAADSRIEIDPVRDAQDVIKIRKDKAKKTGKTTDKKNLSDLNKKVTDAEKKLEAYKKRLQTLTNKLDEKVSAGEFEKLQRQKIELDQEGVKLKEAHELAKANLKAGREALGTITREEITKLIELSKTVADKKKVMEAGGDRFSYGAAKVEYENYVNNLKGENASIRVLLENRLNEFKTTFKENPAQAIWEGTVDSIKTITDTSIGLVATLDNSFLGRQGLSTLQTHPASWWEGAKNSFIDFAKTVGNKNAFDALRADVYSRENYLNGKYEAAKVIAKHEEQYPTSLPDRIPLIGKVFKASEVAFKGSGLRMRTDLFDLLEKNAKGNGVNTTDSAWLKDTGKMINALTARGQWGKRGEGTFVRIFLWAPKMLKANLDVMSMHGLGAGFKTNWARKQAAINLLKIVGETATVMMIAKAINPDSVEPNPTSSDYGKIKIGETRFDITGGKAAIVTLAARLIKNHSKSATTDLITPYGEGYGERSRFDAILDFLMNKVTPPISLITQWLKGETRQGEEFTIGRSVYSGFTPISLQNFIDLKDGVSADKIAGAIIDIIGISANTYDNATVKRFDIINRFRKGQPLTNAQLEAYENMTEKEKEYIDKEASMSAIQAAFSHLSTEAMIYAWSKAIPAQREELQDIYDQRISNYEQNLTDEELDEFRQKVSEAE